MSDASEHSYSVRQIADRMHLSECTITRLLRAGTSRGAHAGKYGAWRVSRAEVLRWRETLYSGGEHQRELGT
jgi:excisionase family DNA binding protein